MRYLLFYREGFIKKFPLDKPCMTIGRSGENELVIKEDFISRKYAKITVKEDVVILEDLGSTNGIYLGGGKIKKGILKIGECFNLGGMEFLLKEGSLDEFKLEEELIPIFKEINIEKKMGFEDSETRYIKDIYTETLKKIIQVGLTKQQFGELIQDLSSYLSVLSDDGSFFVVARQGEDINILVSVESESGAVEILKKIISAHEKLFMENIVFMPISDTPYHFYSYAIKLDQLETALIFIANKEQKNRSIKLERFLSSLAKEISLLSQIVTETKPHKRKKDRPPGIQDDIIAASSKMKELVKQAKKIARSDIFVLIEGESGTGKELFAKIIHNHSKRCTKEIVALNCAAIPENLLESELFGHEKGAFTGAYAQKRGKLEVASGSTLILDEIGDMPLNLQAKLLRALQENEFYRLGGTTPIKVDLRIISITNQDLKQLIKEGKFREDLYYRLVHRTLTIPPLRERQEDISILINHFTNKFCQQLNKSIKGYTVRAFEALKQCDWKGNVRQLENEIRTIVNLTDNGETIGYDILSDEIRSKEPPTGPGTPPKTMAKERDKEYILNLLEKNRWNKSKTADELGMTYRGLHKKMKRLGIEKSSL